MSKTDCDCKEYDEEVLKEYRDERGIVEVVYCCSNCKRKTSIWSYGQWFDVSDDE
mgnify:FL=1